MDDHVTYTLRETTGGFGEKIVTIRFNNIEDINDINLELGESV